MIFPPPLASGARVALVAPAGPLRGPQDLERALANTAALGWEGVVAPHALHRERYFAGTDAERLADLNDAIDDSSIDGIWCLRGGYGTMRLLDGVHYDGLRAKPKAVLGYSDITALHCAIGARAGVVTYHAPVARAPLPAFSRQSLERVVTRCGEPCGPASGARALLPGTARGRLVGTNLALLTALGGTPYAPDYTGAILVLEDVHEEVYRLDRMLCQLHLGGALARCAGIVFGAFTDVPAGKDDPSGTDPARTKRELLDRLLEDTARAAGVPCIAGAPIGHIDEQWTLPLGATATLRADDRTLTIEH